MLATGGSLLREKISKLEKRLEHQRKAGAVMDGRSILFDMNERAVMEMELKLFRLKRLRKHQGIERDAPRPLA